MNKLKQVFLRKKKKKESWFKYIMSVLHLWLGLLSSIIIFIVCLTGSIYAFKQQIEDFVNRDVVYFQPSSNKSKVVIDSLLINFEKYYGKATSITIYDDNDKNILISSFSKNNKGTSAYYNPFSGKIVGVKSTTTKNFFSFILDIHRFLLAGEIGKLINGIAVLIFVFMLFSGFIMWLPKKLKQLKKRLVIKFKAKFYRVNYDLHKVLGFYSILMLFFISITGLYVSFHWVKNAVIVSLGGDSIIISDTNIALQKNLSKSFNTLLDDLSKEDETTNGEVTSIQFLIKKTDSIFSYSGTSIIQLPNELIKNYGVAKMNNHNLLGFNVPDKLDFSTNGSVRRKQLFKNLELHEQFKVIAKPLHTGEIMGLPSIILYFFISFIGCSLPVTGFIIWWKKT